MHSNYLLNPLNKRKKQYKYYTRLIENFLNKFFFSVLIFALSPIFVFNYFRKKNQFYIEDFFNQNASVYFILILKNIHEPIFTSKLVNFYKIIKRFGLLFVIKNLAFKLSNRKDNNISFINKRSKYFLNSDYFSFFDYKISESKNNFMLPFYLPKKYYLDKKELSSYYKLRNNSKKFKIIFSGSSHEDWYNNLKFTNMNGKKFLTRSEIIDTTINHFKNEILIVNSPSELYKVESSDKKIIFLLTDPNKSLRNKNFTTSQHINCISKSNFFLCMPGTSMPICYHLIESCMVGTVPILSYQDFVFPKFRSNEAMFFFTKKELIQTINYAINIEDHKYKEMQNNIINYYDKNLSIHGVAKKIKNKNLPLEVFTNFDHFSEYKRRLRCQLKNLS